MTSTGLRCVTVIGCGLIGTSIALALTRAGVEVALEDRDRDALDQARRMGAGRELAPDTPPADLVVIATPPATVVDVLYTAQARGLGCAYTDVAGTKGLIWAEAEMRGSDLMGYIPGHPVTGRGDPGPGAAQADLFAGQPWILCPYPTAQPEALDAVDALVSLCGGVRRDMTPEEHDEAVAAVSHVPRLVCSALAAQLAGLDREVLSLACAGLRETMRIAGGQGLWGEIVAQNPEAVADAVDRIAGRLSAVAHELRKSGEDGSTVLADLLGLADLGRTALIRAAPGGEAVPGAEIMTCEGAPADGKGAPADGRGDTGEGAEGPEGPRARQVPGGRAERPVLGGWTLPLSGAVGPAPEQPPPHRRRHEPLRVSPGRPAGPVPRIHRFAG